MLKDSFDYQVFIDDHDKSAEQALFDAIDMDATIPRPIFVVCAPRVGSTLIYQALTNVFNFSYFSNSTNDLFSRTPALGVLRECIGQSNQYLLSYFSRKTAGLRESSEASAIFGNWFGGGHPSEIVSATAIDTKKVRHIRKTFSAIKAITERETVSKNPWNSFRIKSLHEYFPQAVFVWIRRSIESAAISDLENRIARGDPAKIWNSATTHNYKEIQERPYEEQVVLQQYHYSLSIQESLKQIDSSQVFEIWYEDLCSKPRDVFSELDKGFSEMGLAKSAPTFEALDEIRPSKGVKNKLPSDFSKIVSIIENSTEYSSMLYSSQK